MVKNFLRKDCGKCGKEIDCHAQVIEKCPCTSIHLSDSTKHFLSLAFFNCLCNECLETINRQVSQARKLSYPNSKDEFIEGVHYYREGHMWVFTELYHILKGHCCGNGCRHCPYGKSFKLLKK